VGNDEETGLGLDGAYSEKGQPNAREETQA
jgi:hypothetical protein